MGPHTQNNCTIIITTPKLRYLIIGYSDPLRKGLHPEALNAKPRISPKPCGVPCLSDRGCKLPDPEP